MQILARRIRRAHRAMRRSRRTAGGQPIGEAASDLAEAARAVDGHRARSHLHQASQQDWAIWSGASPRELNYHLRLWETRGYCLRGRAPGDVNVPLIAFRSRRADDVSHRNGAAATSRSVADAERLSMGAAAMAPQEERGHCP